MVYHDVKPLKTVAAERAPARGRSENLKPWRPGQSGNPGGVGHAEREVRALLRVSSLAVAERLIEIALDRNEDPRASIVAAKVILERAFGRAREADPMPPEPMRRLNLGALSEDELALLRRLLSKASPRTEEE